MLAYRYTMNTRISIAAGTYPAGFSHKVFQRLLTSFLILFFTINPILATTASAQEIGHNPQASGYETVVDGIGQSPNVSVTTPSGALPSNTPLAPISSPGQVEVSSGAFTYAYNFALPKGPGDMVPPLEFSYDSRRRNYDSSTGIGFVLTTPSISRVNKYGIDRMYEDTSFTSSIHGELVKLSKEQDVYGVYGVKNGYGRYVFNRDNSWTFTDKEGTTYVFGAKSTEREFMPTDDAKISQWSLSSMTDADKHTYKFVYDKVAEKLFPIAILYPNDVYKVDIGWSRAPQVVPTYENGYAQGVSSRRPIQVVMSALGTKYRTYGFTFNTTTLRLEKITDSVMGDTTFSYTEVENLRNAVVLEKPLWNVLQYRVDIDGDGQQDTYRVESNVTPTKRMLTIGSTTYQNMPHFDGFADVNNDGAVDGYSTDGCYRTYQGDGVFSASICNIGLAIGDKMIFEDVNNDGIIEYITTKDKQLQVYKFQNGQYVLDPTMKAVGATMWDNMTNYMTIFDINGDNQKDIFYEGSAYLNRGTYFEFSNNYQVDTSNRYYFPNAGKTEYFYEITPVDYNADGLLEVKIKETWKEQCSQGWCAKIAEQKFLNSGHGWVSVAVDYWNNFTSFNQERVPLITTITQPNNDTTTMTYGLENIAKSNILGSVKKVIVVKSITSPYNQTQYAYTNGKFYFNQKEQTSEFAGFETVTAADGSGRKVISYFHQGNDTNTAKGEFEDSRYKIGRMFRQELQSATGALLKTVTTKWIQADLGSERYLAVPEYTTQLVDGVGTAIGYTYDTAVGELVRQYNFGDVTVNTDGSFTDVGTDLVVAKYHYKTNGTLVVRDEEQVEKNGELLAHARYTYSPALTKLIKEEKAQMSGSFVSRTFAYSAQGNLVSSTDYMGNITTYAYDTYGLLPKTITNALGHTTTFEYDYIAQKPSKIIGADGIIHTYVYDVLGNELEYYRNGVKERVGWFTNKFQDHYYTQHLNTSTSISVDQTYVQTLNFYDGLMRLIRQTDANGNHMLITYDQYGRVSEKTIPHTGTLTDSKKIKFTYDDLDRVLTQTTADGATRYTYTGRTVTVTNPANQTKIMEYDSVGSLIAVTEGGFTTRYTYDGNNNLVRLVDQEGNIKEQSFDMLGHKLLTTDLRASTTQTFGKYYFVYDSNGNLTQEIKPDNATVFHTYDKLGRRLTTAAGNDVTTFTYDTCMAGKLCSETRGSYYSKTYTYTPKAQIKSITETIHDKTVTIQYEYMGVGDLVTKVTYPGTVITYEYRKDKIVQIKKDGVALIGTVNYEYGRLKDIQYANGLRTVNTYNENNLYRLAQRTTTNSANLKLQNVTYAYNNLGLITQLADTSDTATKKTVGYTYDDLQRLITATYTIGTETTTENFTYSPSGNLLSSPRGTMRYGEFQALNAMNMMADPSQDNGQTLNPAQSQVVTVPESQPEQPITPQAPTPEPEQPVTPENPTPQPEQPLPSFETQDGRDGITLKKRTNALLSSARSLVIGEYVYAEDMVADKENEDQNQTEVPIATSSPDQGVAPEATPQVQAPTCGEEGVSIATCVIPDPEQQTTSPECPPEGILVSGRCLLPEKWTNSQPAVTCAENEIPIADGCARQVTALLASNSTDSDPLTLDQLVDRLRGKLITIYQTSEGFIMSLVTGEMPADGVRVRQDIAGKVEMVRDSQSVAVVFEKPLPVVPTITVTPQGPITGTPYISNVSASGFTINLTSPVLQSVIFHYYAFGIPESELQTSGTIPVPTTPTVPPEASCPTGFEKDAQGNCIPELSQDNSGVVHPHAVTSLEQGSGSINFTYDSRGNLIGDGARTYTWSTMNELISSQSAGSTVHYNYAPSHDKIYEEEVSGDAGAPVITKTYFFSSLINRNGVIEIALPYGIVLKNGTPTYTFADHLGTVQIITDQAGVATDVFDTYAYGDGRVKTGNTDAKYALHEYDNNLVYMKARYYNPLTGSFISQDPTVLVASERYLADPLQLNAYGYARGNPVNFNDPDGNQVAAAMVIAPALESSIVFSFLGASSSVGLYRSPNLLIQSILDIQYLMSKVASGNKSIPIPQGLSLAYAPNPEDPDDFLKSVDESRQNGHIRIDHLGKSRQELLSRIQNDNSLTGSTAFRSSEIAEHSIKEGLKSNKSQIDTFLKNSRIGQTKQLDYNTGKNIGYGYTRSISGEIIKTSQIQNVRIAIQKISSTEYRIITSFPKVIQ